MSLILAVEPDRRQSSKLAMIGRNQLRAELIVADSVGVSALIARVNEITEQADGIRKKSS